MLKGYKYQSDFAKKFFAQGFAEGYAEGFAEGLAEARAEPRARHVLIVLRARGLAVPDAARERILSQKDTERLERWLEKAAVADSVAAVLDEPS